MRTVRDTLTYYDAFFNFLAVYFDILDFAFHFGLWGLGERTGIHDPRRRTRSESSTFVF